MCNMRLLLFAFLAFCLVAGGAEATGIHGDCGYDANLDKFEERCDARRDHLAVKIDHMIKRFDDKIERFEKKVEARKEKKEKKWEEHHNKPSWSYKWDKDETGDYGELCSKIGKGGWLRVDRWEARRDHMLERLERRQERLERYCAAGGDGNNVIPEPASLILLGSGLAGLLALRGKKKG